MVILLTFNTISNCSSDSLGYYYIYLRSYLIGVGVPVAKWTLEGPATCLTFLLDIYNTDGASSTTKQVEGIKRVGACDRVVTKAM